MEKKKSYKKKEGPGDPLVKRQQATASETHLGTLCEGERRFCAADLSRGNWVPDLLPLCCRQSDKSARGQCPPCARVVHRITVFGAPNEMTKRG